MKKILLNLGLWFCGTTIAFCAIGQQQTPDVGLVNKIAGAGTYSSAGSPSKPVQAYMRLRQGDRIVLAQGAVLQISYFTAGVKESWTGAATFVVTNAGGELLKGAKPDIAKLPGSVADTLSRAPRRSSPARVKACPRPSPEVSRRRALRL